MYKHGRVKFYDSRPAKRFGFVIVDGIGKDVYFHQANIRGAMVGLISAYPSVAVKPSREIQTGDRVVIYMLPGRKGRLSASDVMLEEDFAKALEAVGQSRFRVVSRDYMVIRGERIDGQVQVVWEGNVFDLCDQYSELPRPIRGADGYRLEYSIEMQYAPGGDWYIPEADPREQMKREAFTVTTRAVLADQSST